MAHAPRMLASSTMWRPANQPTPFFACLGLYVCCPSLLCAPSGKSCPALRSPMLAWLDVTPPKPPT